MGRYRNIVEPYGTLQSVTEALQQRYGVLWSVTEHYGALDNVTGRHGTLRNRYGKYRFCPPTNDILNCAHHYNVGKHALRYIVLSTIQFDPPNVAGLWRR